MSFLPADYKSPNSSNGYMKLLDGENRIRILSKPILGWEDWINNKPVRYRMDNKPASANDSTKPIRHFWAMVVWNYSEEQIQILQIQQANVRKAIEALSKDSDWGAPYYYDLKIIRTGQQEKTKYAVTPGALKDVEAYIMECFNERPINLEALFDNQDPFASGWSTYTESALAQPKTKASSNAKITPSQALEIAKLVGETSNPTETLSIALKGASVSAYGDIPADRYDKLKAWVLTRIPIDDCPF